MKRRIVDFGKSRRPLKRTKLEDGLFGSSLFHCKFLLVWVCVLGLDYLFEFRFEYLWPLWLLLRSVYDSFRYQGLAFSLLFLLMALTVDALCLLYVPVSWLFLVASACVWVQLVWQTDKGLCTPTFFLWALFVYIEGIVRVKDANNSPFHLDLCRPFAAHCIGYPVVTLSFGFKSYVGFQLRQRKQREVAQINKSYFDIIDEALPKKQKFISEAAPQKCVTGGGSSPNSTNNVPGSGSKPRPQKVSLESKSSNYLAKWNSSSWSSRLSNGSLQAEFEYMQKRMWSNSKSVNDFDGTETQKDKNSASSSSASSKAAPNELQSTKIVNTQQEKEVSSLSATNNLRDVTPSQKDRKIKYKENSKDNMTAAPKDDSGNIVRLECDIKRLKADLQASRQTEQELRNHINMLITKGQSSQDELSQLHTDNDTLQNKLHNLVTARQNDRSTISSLEKRIQDEKKGRKNAETQVSQLEKRLKKLEEKSLEREKTIIAMKSDCTELCRSRRVELETELRRVRRDHRIHESHIRGLERENTALKATKDNQTDYDVLMAALSAMQDKTSHLEKSLSAETKIKLELFSALGDAKRQAAISNDVVIEKNKEIEELKLKITEVLAVSPPSSSFSQGFMDSHRLSMSPIVVSPNNQISRFQMESSHLSCHSLGQSDSFGVRRSPPELNGQNVNRSSDDLSNKSTLDPNARIYTPKGFDHSC